MESLRQQKVNRLLQKELSILFQRHAADFCLGAMTSVTKVNVSPDLAIAKIHLSIYTNLDRNVVFTQVQSIKGLIRKKLGESIKKQVRIIPDLIFFIDDSLDYIENIERLLKS